MVITGASSGIGRATAVALASSGAAVVLVARREGALHDVSRECEAAGGRAVVAPADVTDATAVEAAARRAVERFGRIDAWVNTTAVSVFAPFEEIPLEDFRRVLDVNVMGYVHGARAALPPMRERGKGVLVNVSSILAEVPQPYTHAYVMSKAAVRALAGSLRQELQLRGARGIKVCRVKPATIDTFSSSTPRTTPGARPGPCHRSIPPSAWPGRSSTSSGLPRCEVIVGPIGRNLFMQWKLAPGLTERQMAVQVDKLHLLRAQAAPPTAGNLFDPAPGPGSVDGGWHGRRRTAFRRAASAALVGAGVVAAARQRR